MNKSQSEIKIQLNTLTAPLFSYWELIDIQELAEINNESLLEKNLKKRSFHLILKNNSQIKELLFWMERNHIRETLHLIYEKVYKETIKYHHGDYKHVDFEYDYYQLMVMFKELLK